MSYNFWHCRQIKAGIAVSVLLCVNYRISGYFNYSLAQWSVYYHVSLQQHLWRIFCLCSLCWKQYFVSSQGGIYFFQWTDMVSLSGLSKNSRVYQYFLKYMHFVLMNYCFEIGYMLFHMMCQRFIKYPTIWWSIVLECKKTHNFTHGCTFTAYRMANSLCLTITEILQISVTCYFHPEKYLGVFEYCSSIHSKYIPKRRPMVITSSI